MVVTHRPMPAPSGGGTAGRVVLAFALLAGLGVTLYRNDVLRQAALSTGQEKAYMKMETALGGPGFGTPRAVQLAAPTSLNAAVAEAATRSSVSASSNSQSAVHTEPAKEPVRAAEPEKPASNSASAKAPSPVSLSSLVSAQISAPKAKPKAERAAAPASRPASRPAAEKASSGLGIKGSSNGYDPLNGKL
jgi:hypothetical protein